VDNPVRQRDRTESTAHRLTETFLPDHEMKNPVEQPDTEVGRSPTPIPASQRHNETRSRHISSSVHSGLVLHTNDILTTEGHRPQLG